MIAARRPGWLDQPRALRPRERLANHGAEALSEAELVALLLGTGDGARDARALAAELLARFAGEADPTGLRGLAEASALELNDFRGLGPAKVGRLLAGLELGRRLAERTGSVRPPAIVGPADAWRLLAPRLAGLDRERFVVLLLNRKHAPIAIEVVAVGSLDAVAVHPREVFKPAIRKSAAAVLLAHNHPSGDPTPSPEDKVLTARLLDAGEVLGVPIVDHLVVGDAGFVSLRETTPLWSARPFHH